MKWLRNILVVLFAAGIAVIFLGVIEAQAPWWVNAIMVGIALLAVAPAIAFVCGIQWCRFLVAAMALLFLSFWSMSPLAQHSIDRHAAFWIFWALIEALTIGAIWASLKKPSEIQFVSPQELLFSQTDITERFGDHLSLGPDAWIETVPLNAQTPIQQPKVYRQSAPATTRSTALLTVCLGCESRFRFKATASTVPSATSRM